MSLVETLKDLIEDGRELIPHGGNLVDGYSDTMQAEYVSWRLQSIDAISMIGRQSQPLLREIDNDKYGPFFYSQSAKRILGVLIAAAAIAERQRSPENLGPQDPIDINNPKRNDSVFIVHGHDQALLQQVARFIEKLKISPIVLFEEAGKGQTIIEKLEANSDVCFSVVLLTPDDLGRASKEEGELNPRARQNVLLELGYFIGKLGRSQVVALYDESVELPSDYRGVEYIKIDAEGAWKFKLAKELKAVGLSVDMNDVI